MRSAIAAARGSCVTMTVVWPYVSTESRMSSRISPLVFESRLPVGSSANTIVGRLTSARPIATRCCWPPESSEGRWLRRSSRPILPISSATHFWSGFSPAIESGRTTFSSAFSIGSRLKNWKMKPMCSRRSFVRSVSLSFVMLVPRDAAPRRTVGLSRPARMCISVDFPEPGRAHHGGELAFCDLERDAAKRIDGGLALAVAAGHVRGRRQRPDRASPPRAVRRPLLPERLLLPSSAPCSDWRVSPFDVCWFGLVLDHARLHRRCLIAAPLACGGGRLQPPTLGVRT